LNKLTDNYKLLSPSKQDLEFVKLLEEWNQQIASMMLLGMALEINK